MNKRTIAETVAGAAGILIVGWLVFSWVNAREARARAEATEAANKNALAIIEQHDAANRAQLDAFVKSQQAQMDAMNSRFDQAKSAPDIAALVQQIMALQKPITFVTPPATPENPHPQPVAQVPVEDAPQVKAYVQACETCKLNLDAANQKLTYADQRHADDVNKLKMANDDAGKWKSAAKGGGFWSNLKRSAKWFAIGAAGGAVAVCGTGHCR